MLPINKDNIIIDTAEIYRYLGYGNTSPTAEVAEKVASCLEHVRKASELRSICRSFPVAFPQEKERQRLVLIGNAPIESSDLRRALEGSLEVYLFGATIGVGIDRLIAKATVGDVAAATIYQAIGAAYVESFCDSICDEVERQVRTEGKRTGTRFSPGYGDFHIEYQRLLFELLDLSRQTGIGLTDGMLMTPSKSVTAIIPVTAGDDCRHDPPSAGRRCSDCELKDCPFRGGR